MTAVLILLLIALAAWAVHHTLTRAKKGGGCCGEHEAALKKPAVADRNKAHYPYTVTMTIGGMTCENCARRVEQALGALEGVWATVRIDNHKATVRCKSVPDEPALRQAVRQAGYVVLDLETTA